MSTNVDKAPHAAPASMSEAEAVAMLEAAHAQPTIVNINKTARQYDALAAALARVRIRVACLASFTFDPIRPALVLQGLRSRIGIEPYVAPYGQFEQELLNPASALVQFNADVVLLAIRLQDVCPAIYEHFNSLGEGEAARLIDEWLRRLEAALRVFRERNPASYVLIQNYDQPATPALGLADAASTISQTAMITRANTGLALLAKSHSNVFAMDYDALVARHGRLTWSDPRTAWFGRIPIAPAHYWHLAGFYIRHIRPLYGLTRKVLVLDADHTLWGGVVGDVGRDGIQLGHDFPGNAFVAFQQRVLDLYHRGVILCIASKNEPGAVEDVLEYHPDMVLKAKHFATMRVNWKPKPDSLREMAAELNLGLDSFVFVDDSPVECELMRQALPQVLTITLPTDPAGLPGAIESLDVFDQWSISEEDRRRGELYRAEAGRKALETQAVDLPSFYRALQMKLTIRVDDSAQVVRAAQMTARTNQFNMHTVRCSEDDIRQYIAAPDWHVVTFALEDRFGDNGVIALAVVRHEAAAWRLHMLLASCRILGRTVEQAIVRWLAARAAAAGAKKLDATFIPTPKNKPFAGFYDSCGFRRAAAEGDREHWTLDLASADTAIPDWIEVIEAPPRGPH